MCIHHPCRLIGLSLPQDEHKNPKLTQNWHHSLVIKVFKFKGAYPKQWTISAKDVYQSLVFRKFYIYISSSALVIPILTSSLSLSLYFFLLLRTQPMEMSNSNQRDIHGKQDKIMNSGLTILQSLNSPSSFSFFFKKKDIIIIILHLKLFLCSGISSAHDYPTDICYGTTTYWLSNERWFQQGRGLQAWYSSRNK